jgi:L-asparaginase
VIETLGSGHVPERQVPSLARLAERMPIVYASRVPFGDLFLKTYAYPGAEIDLLRRGLICAGALSGPKARALLAILLAAGATREEIRAAFAALAESEMPVHIS